MAYKPSQVDLEWLKTTLGLLKDGGMMVFPAAQLAFRVSKQNKTLTLDNPDQLQNPVSKVVYERNIEVAKGIGWTVINPGS